MSKTKNINHSDQPFNLEHCKDLSRLKEILFDAGYTHKKLVQTIAVHSIAERMDLQLTLRRTEEVSALNTLIRTFVLGYPVAISRLKKALGSKMIEQLRSIGLLKNKDRKIVSIAKLIPYEDLLILSDFGPDKAGRSLTQDHVIGVGAASGTLDRLTVRNNVEFALDLGTGTGIQSLLAARHVKRTVGTDTNPRALNFAALSARINGLDNIEFRQGSLFEPVENDRFDLIIANPPFVISPESNLTFRDSGLPGDRISEVVIRSAAEKLNEDGNAIILFNWYNQVGQEWGERPEQWLANNNCDSLILHFETRGPEIYASEWLRPLEGQNSEGYRKKLDKWLSYYDEMKIDSISAGAVILKRKSGDKNWIRKDTISNPRHINPCGKQIDRIFSTENLLRNLSSEKDLLELKIAAVPDLQLEHIHELEESRWIVKSARLVQKEGFKFSGEVDIYVTSLLAECDGKKTLKEAFEKVADSTRLSYEELSTVCSRVILNLLRRGLLVIQN